MLVLLQAGTQYTLSRVLSLCNENVLSHETKLKTVLLLAASEKMDPADHDQLIRSLQDSLETWPKGKVKNWRDILEIISRCLEYAGQVCAIDKCAFAFFLSIAQDTSLELVCMKDY